MPIGTDDGEDLALGIGASLNANDTFGLRAEFDWFDIDDADADAVWIASVGFEISF